MGQGACLDGRQQLDLVRPDLPKNMALVDVGPEVDPEAVARALAPALGSGPFFDGRPADLLVAGGTDELSGRLAVALAGSQ